MKHLHHLRWIIPLAMVFGIAWQSLGAGAPLVRTTDFRVRTPVIDVLLPAARAEERPLGVALLKDPIYVDVTLPPRASAATLQLWVSAESEALKLGVQKGSGFDILFPDTNPVEQGDDRLYTLRVSEFAHLEPRYRLRFVISAPQLASGNILVKGARVEIERQPFSLAWLVAALKGESI